MKIRKITIKELTIGDVFLVQYSSSKDREEEPSFDNFLWFLLLSKSDYHIKVILLRQPRDVRNCTWMDVGQINEFDFFLFDERSYCFLEEEEI
jgi:hypothetical protein